MVYRNHTSHPGATPHKLTARYEYRIVSATDHAKTNAAYACDVAVLTGKQNHIIHTWITRVTTCNAVVLTGDLMRPDSL
jgi:hypothetical protein